MKQSYWHFLPSMNKPAAYVLLCVCFLGMAGCATSPPKQQENACSIFEEKGGWYKDAKKATKRWGTPIAVNLAFIHQESRFVHDAKPPRKKILGFIPGPRKSSSYGYSQAKDETWDWYKEKAPHRGADRDKFKDAIDFVAWYNYLSNKKLGIAKNDAYRLYLAYHEGHGGYKRGTYKSKKWLQDVAHKVSRRAQAYQAQLNKCEKHLDKGFWFF